VEMDFIMEISSYYYDRKSRCSRSQLP